MSVSPNSTLGIVGVVIVKSSLVGATKSSDTFIVYVTVGGLLPCL